MRIYCFLCACMRACVYLCYLFIFFFRPPSKQQPVIFVLRCNFVFENFLPQPTLSVDYLCFYSIVRFDWCIYFRNNSMEIPIKISFWLCLCLFLVFFAGVFLKIFFALVTNSISYWTNSVWFLRFSSRFFCCIFFCISNSLGFVCWFFFSQYFVFHVLYSFHRKWYRAYDNDYSDDRNTTNQSLAVFHRFFFPSSLQ